MIDHRRSYKIVIDTETAPIDRTLSVVRPNNMLTYDIGWAIVDKHGNVYRTHSFIAKEIFIDREELMKSAYYANKIPQYLADIEKGSRVVLSFHKIVKLFYEEVKEFGITEVYAHNARFDHGALNNTERVVTDWKYWYFFRKNIKVCDTMKMARDVISTMPSYRKFCEQNGFMTKHRVPRPQLKAETIYRFLTKNTEFIESHTYPAILFFQGFLCRIKLIVITTICSTLQQQILVRHIFYRQRYFILKNEANLHQCLCL